MSAIVNPQPVVQRHKLQDVWTLWAHLPHDVDWSEKSYKQIISLDSVEGCIGVMDTIPEKMIVNCMLFIMRRGILPQWEDPKNVNGGCFSYKIPNKNVPQAWKELSYLLLGETLTDNKGLLKTINGITISPKKNFCILKIWLSTCSYQDPRQIVEMEHVPAHGCLFKKHMA
jgi:translation initiation factor 4E